MIESFLQLPDSDDDNRDDDNNFLPRSHTADGRVKYGTTLWREL